MKIKMCIEVANPPPWTWVDWTRRARNSSRTYLYNYNARYTCGNLREANGRSCVQLYSDGQLFMFRMEQRKMVRCTFSMLALFFDAKLLSDACFLYSAPSHLDCAHLVLDSKCMHGFEKEHTYTYTHIRAMYFARRKVQNCSAVTKHES